MEMNREQLDQVKAQLSQAQAVSHFVIFETIDPQTNTKVNMVTDINGFRAIQQSQNVNAEMRVIRDFVPVTDNLARWAIAEHDAANAKLDNEADLDRLVNRMDQLVNAVLIENQITPNK